MHKTKELIRIENEILELQKEIESIKERYKYFAVVVEADDNVPEYGDLQPGYIQPNEKLDIFVTNDSEAGVSTLFGDDITALWAFCQDRGVDVTFIETKTRKEIPNP